jgi:heme-degrading monooxygenase HmoA
MSQLAKTPEPPYYAVIFTSLREGENEDYNGAAARMAQLSEEMPGFLGMEHARSDGLSVTVCYWRSREDIANWKQNAEHQQAQNKGRELWYQAFATRICKVERDNFFEKGGEA